jgi:hypothetical protein
MAMSSLLLVWGTVAGCSSSRDATVEGIAADFRGAVRAQDGDLACRQLSDAVRFQLELSSGSRCEVEVRDAGLPTSGTLREVTVSGTAAQVRYDDDVIFLGEFGGGWRIIGAGCLSRADGPYDCQVS